MSVGPLVIAASLLLFARLGDSGDYLTAVLPAAVVFGFGVAIMVAPLTATALAAAPADHAGIASAVNNDVARAAGLIAVAMLPALAGITGESYLHPAAARPRLQDGGADGGGRSAPPGACWPRSPSATRPGPGARRRPRAEFNCALEAHAAA